MKIYPLIVSIFFAATPTIFSDKSKAKSIIPDTNKSIELSAEGDKKRYFYDDHKSAIEDYTESLKFNSKNTYALFSRAYSKSELKDYEGAVEDLNQLLAIDPSNGTALYNRARANANLKRNISAIKDYSKAISKKIELQHSYFNRGILKELIGDAKGACDDWGKGIEKGNSNKRAKNVFAENCLPSNFARFELKTKNNLIMKRARERNLAGDRRGACEDYQLAKSNGYVAPKKYKLFYKVITDPYCFLRTL